MSTVQTPDVQAPEKQQVPKAASASAPLEALGPTKTAWRLPVLDGLRAMSCVMVYFIHSWMSSGSPDGPTVMTLWGHDFSWTVRIVHTLFTFVDLFMVLCGFCLFWPLCKTPEAIRDWSWTNYVYRRLRRICPPYYAAIAFVILLPQLLVVCTRLLGGEAKFQPNPSMGSIVSHLAFAHTLFPAYWADITGSFWSLGLEMQFYLVFPLVVFLCRRQRLAVIAGMIVASIIFRTMVNILLPDQNDQRLWTISFLGRWMEFAVGMAAAIIAARYYRRGQLLRGWVGTTAVVAAIGAYVLAWNGTIERLPAIVQLLPWQTMLISISCGLLIFAVTSTRTFIRRIFESKPVVKLGLMSYSFYLIHQTCAWFIAEFLRKRLHLENGPQIWLINSTLGLALVMVLAYPFYRVFEKPFISAPKKKAKPAAARPPRVPVSTSTAA